MSTAEVRTQKLMANSQELKTTKEAFSKVKMHGGRLAVASSSFKMKIRE
ncbi:hypothetical protein [Ekhidna sp.]